MFFTRDKSFYKTLVTLAIPIALQNAVTFAVGLADNVMIGTLGDSAISGVYVGSQLQTLLQMFIGGIEGAILILAAQYWGKRDTKSIRRIAAIGVRFALLIGLVITVTAFLLPSQIVSLFTSDASVIESGTVYVRVVTSFRTIFFCYFAGDGGRRCAAVETDEESVLYVSICDAHRRTSSATIFDFR